MSENPYQSPLSNSETKKRRFLSSRTVAISLLLSPVVLLAILIVLSRVLWPDYPAD